MSQAIVRLKNGSTYSLRGAPGELAEKVNAHRGQSQLVGFDNDRMPIQQVYLDPDEVASIQAML